MCVCYIYISSRIIKTTNNLGYIGTPCSYDTRKCGAEINTANVAIIVNKVNIIRHSRSTTIAANFQSFVISPFSSSFFNCVYIVRLVETDKKREREIESEEEKEREIID